MGNQFCLTWIGPDGIHGFLDFDEREQVKNEILHLVTVQKVEQHRIVIFRRPGMSVEQFLHGSVETKCPDCEVAMEHIPVESMRVGKLTTTHIYSCPDCPNVMFEYSDSNNIVDLVRYLNRDHLHHTKDVITQLNKDLISPAPSEPVNLTEAEWVELVKHDKFPCSLNGVVDNEGNIEYVCEADGNTEYFSTFNEALEDYVLRVAKYSREGANKSGEQ